MKFRYLLLVFSIISGLTFIVNTQYNHHEKLILSMNSMEFSQKNSIERLNELVEKDFLFLKSEATLRVTEVGPYYRHARNVKWVSDSLIDYIENLKIVLIEKAGGLVTIKNDGYIRQIKLIDIYSKNHLDYLFNDPNDNQAENLKRKIIATREKLNELMKDNLLLRFNPKYLNKITNKNYLSLTFDSTEYSSWIDQNFKNSHLIEAIVILSNLQIDTLCLESEIIGILAATCEHS